jgi:RimJ/RimL family protein N-acetyltransferase
MVILKPLEISFAPKMVEAALESIAEVQPWMPWCSSAFDEKAAESWINDQIRSRENKSAFEFALFSESGTYLGGGGVNNIDDENNKANVGYWIRSSQIRKGYGTEALKALVEWARGKTELNRLEVVAAIGNLPSQRVAEKAGGLREGVAKARLLLHSKYHDAAIFSFVKNV